jgi:NAD(P)-dependent dehydrogenase (short-subunit alcohol dehydrogenase family)
MKGAVMKILVAGATGALGKQLVPRLVAGGHDVAGMIRNESKIATVRSLGATPVVADALEPEEVARAVGEVGPVASPTSVSGCRSRSWLSPPVIPADQAEMADSLSLAFLVLLESHSFQWVCTCFPRA